MNNAPIAMIVALTALLGCGETALKRTGEPCSASAECGTGLICDYGVEPHICSATGTPLPDAPVVDASADADESEAGVVDATIDATPIDAAIDAPAIDAALIDALPIDAL